MKVQVIYTSLTGCTRTLAEAIYHGIDIEEKSIHDLKDGVPVLDGDVILLGFWGMGGHACPEMQALFSQIKGKAVGVFLTLGYYADSLHAFDTLKTATDVLKENNLIIGTYAANGAIASYLKKGQGVSPEDVPASQKELRWEMIASHPTKAECALGAERFSERIHLYKEAVKRNIELKSVL